MVMLAEHYDFVIGGDPDRDTIDLAVLDTSAGRVQAHLADSADGPGYHRMLTWAGEHAPGRRIWALEGTGSFAAGLVVVLLDAGETVVEVGALKRARGAKNDRIDAIRAARQALARDEQGAPRAGGLREALRMVFACREGVLVSRTKAINELKSLIVVAPRADPGGTAWPVAGRPADQDRGAAGPDSGASRTAPVRVQSAVHHRTGAVPVGPARRARSSTTRADQAAPGRTDPAHRTGSRTGCRRAATDQLVPSRARPQRSRVRLASWRCPTRNQQRSTLAASPQPRW